MASARRWPGFPADGSYSRMFRCCGFPHRRAGRLPADLNALVPAATTQFTIGGGLQMPGLIRKWSALLPPEIRALTVQAGKRGDHGDLPAAAWIDGHAGHLRVAHDGGAIVCGLADSGLPDGDYEVVLAGVGHPNVEPCASGLQTTRR